MTNKQMTKKNSIKLEKVSKVILFWMIAFVAVLTSLSYFITSWNAAMYIAPALVFGIALFVFAEVQWLDGFKRKDIWRMAGAVVAMVAILGVILEIIPGMPVVQALETFKGALSALLALYFVVEGLR